MTKMGIRVFVTMRILYLWPVEPLKVGRFKGLRQAKSMINGYEAVLILQPAVSSSAQLPSRLVHLHQQIAGMSIRVEQSDVQDADPVHISHRIPAE